MRAAGGHCELPARRRRWAVAHRLKPWTVRDGVVEVALVLRRPHVRHEAARIVDGPVLAHDESRFDAVRFEAVQEDGVLAALAYPHSRAKRAALDAVLDGCRPLLEDGFHRKAAQARRLVVRDFGLGLLAVAD